MRQETNNEIDLLLRRMSRQDGGSVRDQHLDADELSSYAQNALPAAARARYMEHLAECSTCRKLVTELSLSLGATAAAAVPVETIAAPSALKKFLASLFSPMVLRYAIPALAVIIVGVIGFAIFREKGSNTFVARLDERQSAPATADAPAPSSSPNTTVANKLEKEQSAQAAEPNVTTPQPGYVGDQAAGTGPAPAGTPAAPENTAAPVTQSPKVAAAEPPPAKADTAAENEEQKKQEEKTKDVVARKEPAPAPTIAKAAETNVASAKPNEQARDYNAAPSSADRIDESKRDKLPLQGRGALAGESSTRRARSQTGSADAADAETRTVSGRRFRKERGIWTDTAYDSSTPIVSMARGSEQFRALVADEPEIKKIAEQLDGEVIVVWKGRAYRIR
jgi:hypothetical protein